MPKFYGAHVGERCGYRDPKGEIGSPLTEVEVLKFGPPLSQKVRIRWHEGEFEGTEQWVNRRRLLARWDQREQFIFEELAWEAVYDASELPEESIDHEALSFAVGGLPEHLGLSLVLTNRRYAIGVISNVETLAHYLGLNAREIRTAQHSFTHTRLASHEPLGLVVTYGTLRSVVIQACQRYASVVLADLRLYELANQAALTTGHYQPPHYPELEYSVNVPRFAVRVEKEDVVFAQVREWCSQVEVDNFNQIQALGQELERLREVIRRASDRLRGQGNAREADALLRDTGLPLPKRTRKR